MFIALRILHEGSSRGIVTKVQTKVLRRRFDDGSLPTVRRRYLADGSTVSEPAAELPLNARGNPRENHRGEPRIMIVVT